MFLDRVPQIGDFLQMGIFIIFFWVLSHLQTFTNILRNILVMRRNFGYEINNLCYFYVSVFSKLVVELELFFYREVARLHTNTVEC